MGRELNPKETLSQNYRRLGLATKLNHVTGGVEKTGPGSSADALSARKNDCLTIDGKAPTTIDVQEARIERDSATGELRILDDPSARRKLNPLNDPLNELSDFSGVKEWEGFGNVPQVRSGAGTTVGRELKGQASQGVRKAPRKQSAREEEWIEKMVEKYADDYGKMVRNRKLNVVQQSEGDIRRRDTAMEG
ncbi:hypothetical protein H2201_008945 [Coniosporium apollinis]|uniref:Nucleolar protein 16 n=2 Tax=Coniosporium TaxID=2810619 RepID=A0ABQ9NF10_9PEZI|nr:hypothetical protein H2199_009185 [Cladosporium sp. JES 115]KAJ9654762.1 hypothetical protein H2201_008945 [Coniosporium apollinis]